jgi:SHO1 osmosensor
MNRFQISTFGAIAIVFSVIGVQEGVFTGLAALDAMGAGWLILAIVNILWVLYFTSEEDSLTLHIFNLLGTGGLTPPSRRRRTRAQADMAGNGYATNYASGGGIGSHDMTYDTKMGSGMGSGMGMGSQGGAGVRSQNSFGGASEGGMGTRSLGTGAAGSMSNLPQGGPGSVGNGDNGPSSPLMAGQGGTTLGSSGGGPDSSPDTYLYKAKALYACTCLLRRSRSGDILTYFILTQTPPRLTTRMRYRSPRASSSTSWTSRASGGRLKRVMDPLEVRPIPPHSSSS